MELLYKACEQIAASLHNQMPLHWNLYEPLKYFIHNYVPIYCKPAVFTLGDCDPPGGHEERQHAFF